MKKIFMFFIAVTLFVSCKSSEAKRIIITPEEEILFSEENEFFMTKDIIIPNNGDTIVIDNPNLVKQFCFLRLSSPERNIEIYYFEDERGEADVRFINPPSK